MRKNQYGVDDAGVQYMSGYLSGVTKSVKTDQYVGSVVNYVHGRLAPRFDIHLDMLARMTPRAFHHVYEWPSAWGASDTIGNPRFRLWRQTLVGNGRSKTAGFYFVSSRRAVPVHPLLAEPGPSGKHVKIGFHIFHWKAAVMEYGMDVTIEPKLGEWLAFVPGKSNFKVFTTKAIETQGGTPSTRGSFTNAFVRWWSTEATDYFDRVLAPRLADDLVKEGALSRRVGATSTKTFTIGTASTATAYRQGEAKARAQMNKNEREYIMSSLERMSNLGRL